MKAIKPALLALLCAGASATSVLSQSFSSGSDGTYGPLNVTATTNIPMPVDGIFNCTTINVASGQTLRFTRNANNTPVVLLATGNVTVAGSIEVSGGPGNNVVGGAGGPGGFDGGSPGSVSLPPGAGHGPGAGLGGINDRTVAGAGGGSYATVGINTASTNQGATYGSALLVPPVGGSGGGGTVGTPGNGGGGGGGAILIASTTRIDVSGSIVADGARKVGGAYNSGSGGAIRLVAPVVAGNGILYARGSAGTGEGGGDGRIRIDAINRTGIAFNIVPAATTSIGSMMMVFPAPLPRLDVTEAAGQQIPVGSAPVVVILPFGSDTNRTVKVRAINFNDTVPIELVLTPDNGTPKSYSAQIDNRTTNPAEITVNVVIPVNVQTAVSAWTR